MDQVTSGFQPVVDEICSLAWSKLDQAELTATAWAYYFFSVQFRESLQVTLQYHPDDAQVQCLVREECDTANLSPWPGVAAVDEKLNHDEFMARVLKLSPINAATRDIVAAGHRYLATTRQMDDQVKIMSIASYEDGGLESVFKAIMQARDWNTALLAGFRHFLIKHIDFDGDPAGHGAMIRHLAPDDRVRPMWVEFRDLLITAVPNLIL